MSNWEPISKIEILEKIRNFELTYNGQSIYKIWKAIKIEPEKWSESSMGEEGGGFWIVAISGKKVIWYNDIEEGFNISSFLNYGIIDTYEAEQDELQWTISKLMKQS